MKNNKFVLMVIVLFFLTIYDINAEEKKKPVNSDGTSGAKVVKPLDYSKKKCEDLGLVREDILKYIQDVYKKVSKNKIDLPIILNNYSVRIHNYSKLKDIEEETKIKRIWFKSIAQTLHRIYVCRSALETAKMNKNAKEFSQNKVKYVKLLAYLKKVYQHPPKIKIRRKKRV